MEYSFCLILLKEVDIHPHLSLGKAICGEVTKASFVLYQLFSSFYERETVWYYNCRINVISDLRFASRFSFEDVMGCNEELVSNLIR